MMPPEFPAPGVHVAEVSGDGRTISGVPTATTAFIGSALRGPTNRAVPVRSVAEFEQRFGGLSDKHELGYALRQFFLNGGVDARVVRVAQRPSLAQVGKALSALDAVDLINLLALPGLTAAPLLQVAADYCKRRRALLIADPPADAKTPDQIAQVLAGGGLPRTSHAAIYFPRIRLVDPISGLLRVAPPSGTIAGLMARMDNTRVVWKTPSGAEASLAGVQGLEYRMTDAENARLNPAGINCLRQFPATGLVAWGARTLASGEANDAEFKYISVRRLALFLEQSLDRGTQWAVSEPNGEPLWASLRRAAGDFLQKLFRQGAFQGATPRAAYFVKCDRETTTSDDIDQGVVNLEVGFAPIKPAEFVVIKLQQRAGPNPS